MFRVYLLLCETNVSYKTSMAMAVPTVVCGSYGLASAAMQHGIEQLCGYTYIAGGIILTRVRAAFIDLHTASITSPAWYTVTLVTIYQVLKHNTCR